MSWECQNCCKSSQSSLLVLSNSQPQERAGATWWLTFIPCHTCLTADAYTEGEPEPGKMTAGVLDSELLVSNDVEDDIAIELDCEARSCRQPSEGTAPPSAALHLDMQEVFKRSAATLNIPWPAMQEETSRSHYDRKKLCKKRKTGKQLLPSSQNSRMSWLLRGGPSYTYKHLIPGGSLLTAG